MGLPEFVLKKLIDPNSIKKSSTGFSFILKNSFARGTITRFELSVGDSNVPGENIIFSSSGSLPQKAIEINSENPTITPVGVEVLVTITDQPLSGEIKLKIMTKEIGEIEFSISPHKRKKRGKGFRPGYLSFLSKPIEARMDVHIDKTIGKASPFLCGHFVEHLERCVYDGIWTSDGKNLRSDTLELIKQINPPMIRYPGGNFASGYHWEDGIGPKEHRPHRHDAAWQAEEPNAVGTDEFLTFCEEIGTEPFLAINDGSGSPEEAARWVEYCNSPVTSTQGKRRAKNGHPEPYNVKYWGVGNEVWAPWQIGTTSAKEYTLRLIRFIKAMEASDLDIKIIAVGNHPLTDDPTDPALLWNEEVLKHAGTMIDYLSWHIYQPEKNGWNEHPDPKELFRSICAAPIDIDSYIKKIEKQIERYSPNHRVLQALDEWNVWLPPLEGATSMHEVTFTMRDAIYVASTLAVLYRNNRAIEIANLAQLVNVLPLIKTNSNSAIATAIFYPFLLYGQMESNIIDVSINSPTFSSQPLGENISAHG
jgi:alpha-N-arabinofuranosidase